jgi:hypothetical protein
MPDAQNVWNKIVRNHKHHKIKNAFPLLVGIPCTRRKQFNLPYETVMQEYL